MDDITLTKNLDDIIAMLKSIERKMIEEGKFDKDVFIMHMAVLRGYDDMADALNFLMDMYGDVKEE